MLQQQTMMNLKHSENHSEDISDPQSDQQMKKNQPRDHSSNFHHSDIVKDALYKKCFPMRQRIGTWFYNTFTCVGSDDSYIDKLNKLENRHSVLLSQNYQRLIKDNILRLKIMETSRLQLDSNVIHPFVKVHIIDKSAGCYLTKNHEQYDPIIYHNQSITYYDNIQRKYASSENNIILPFATTMCDFRKMGNSYGKWNQKFYINFPADKVMHPDTVFLFEILDFNHQALLYKDTDIYDKDYFYRVAWSYLRPVGMSKTHFGVSKLQLYKYKFNNKKAEGQLNQPHIPGVYYDFIWNNHEKYEGFLSVQLTYRDRPKDRFIDDGKQWPEHLFEAHRPDPTFIRRQDRNQESAQIQGPKLNMNLLKFYKNNDRSEIPQDLIYKLQSDKRGCYRTLFIGNYLFAACPNKKHTSIKVYSLDKGQKVMSIKGHRQLIYSMTKTINQKYLITAGSDHIVKVWEVPNNFGEYIDEDESQNYLRGQCVHSAAVYSTSSIHMPLNNKLYIVTCCYDGYIRLWNIDLQTQESIVTQILVNTYDRSPDKVYPTASAVSEANYFIIGDSNGDIRIFDFAQESLRLKCQIYPEELRNDEVLSIKILNKNNILIQASDNLVWHFQLSGNRMKMVEKYSGAQFETRLSDCAVSPDNKYLLAPSESGKPFMWDLFSGVPLSLDHLNLQVKGPLVTVSWHNQYNLVAFGGFIEYCPVMVYGNILSESQQKMVAASLK